MTKGGGTALNNPPTFKTLFCLIINRPKPNQSDLHKSFRIFGSGHKSAHRMLLNNPSLLTDVSMPFTYIWLYGELKRP